MVYQHIQASYWAAPDATKQEIVVLTSPLVRDMASAEIAEDYMDETLARLSELGDPPTFSGGGTGGEGDPPYEIHNEDELQDEWFKMNCAELEDELHRARRW